MWFEKLVNQSEVSTNRPYFIYFVKITVNPKLIASAEIKAFFIQSGFSSAQIAERYGDSKIFILSAIHRSGIELGTKVGHSADPKNYRNNSPPYGFSNRDGKLVPNKSEMKICRVVVELRGRRKLSTTQVCKELEKRGFKNHKGNSESCAGVESFNTDTQCLF